MCNAMRLHYTDNTKVADRCYCRCEAIYQPMDCRRENERSKSKDSHSNNRRNIRGDAEMSEPTKSKGHANRGKAFEKSIEIKNDWYKANGVAVIHKVPDKWKPLRGDKGKLIGAKIDEQSGVDFMGCVMGGQAIAFDAKETHSGRMALRELKEHQVTFLQDYERIGGLSFVLVSFSAERYYAVPISFWTRLIALREQGNGMASFTAEELDEHFPWMKVYHMDYFDAANHYRHFKETLDLAIQEYNPSQNRRRPR